MEKKKRKSPTQILQEQVAEAERNSKYYEGRYDQASKDLDKQSANRERLVQETGFYREENSRIVEKLFEIIRWHLNPKTAEFPFSAEKSQRPENNNNYPPRPYF